MSLIGGDPGFHSNLFPDGLIPDILELVLDSWEKFKKPVPTDKENPINYRFVMFLRNQKKCRELLFLIDPETPLPDEQTGEERGRIDIRFMEGYDEDVYFAFECKRLRYMTSTGNLVHNTSDYVTSDQGMMCFISGKYSDKLSSGGMLGYVLDGKKHEAKKAVKKLIDKHKANLRLKSNTSLDPSSISPKKVDQTLHVLSDRSFIIYHLFLSV